MRDATASDAQTLAKDKQRQEEAVTQQRQADADCVMVLVEQPDHIDMAIWRIWAECSLCAAPLNAILAKTAYNYIAHDASALLVTTLPPPTTMLSTSPHPTSYVVAFLANMRGSVPSALPLPTIDGQLWTVCQWAQPCCCTGRCTHP